MVAGRDSRGFTLLELLVVLAIMGLLLGLAAPRFHNIVPGFELQSSTRELAAALRETRSRALERGEPALLVVDLAGRRYGLGGSTQSKELPRDIVLEALTAADDISEETRRAGFRFFPDGSATGGRITLSRGEQEYRIDIDWLTGRVSILEGPDA